MSQEIKLGAIIFFVALAVGFGFGRWSAPQSVKTETKTAETKDTDKTDHKKVTVIETKKPDGTDTKTTVITDDSDTKTADNKSSDTTKDVEKSKSRLTVSALACTK